MSFTGFSRGVQTATPGTAQDPSWTLGQWTEESACSEYEDFETAVEISNETMVKLSQGKFQPLVTPLLKKCDDATASEKSHCLKTAETSCRMVCNVIAPKDGDKLYEALTMANMSNDLASLTTAYKTAPTKILKTQILSLYALNYSNEELKTLHEPFEKLSDRQIKKARHQAKISGPGVPMKKVISHRVRIDMVKLDHFAYIRRPPIFLSRCRLWSANAQTREWRTFNHAQYHSHSHSLYYDCTVLAFL